MDAIGSRSREGDGNDGWILPPPPHPPPIVIRPGIIGWVRQFGKGMRMMIRYQRLPRRPVGRGVRQWRDRRGKFGRGGGRRTSGHAHALGYRTYPPIPRGVGILGRGSRGIIAPRAERDGRRRCGGYRIVVLVLSLAKIVAGGMNDGRRRPVHHLGRALRLTWIGRGGRRASR